GCTNGQQGLVSAVRPQPVPAFNFKGFCVGLVGWFATGGLGPPPQTAKLAPRKMGVRERTTVPQRVTELAARRLVFALRQQAAARAASADDADAGAGQPAAALKDRPASEAEAVPQIYPEDGSPAFEGYSLLRRAAALSAAKVGALRNDLAPPEAFRRAVECNPYGRCTAFLPLPTRPRRSTPD
ncbi:MAG: hypothetical protein BJ554DRAFT_5110, partial [Olpidium bornovanus]